MTIRPNEASPSTNLVEAALLRRRATVAGVRYGRLSEVTPVLNESIALAGYDPNARVSAANTMAWLYQRNGEWRAALEVLDEPYKRFISAD